MRIVQYLKAGKDCPENLAGNLAFARQVILVTRRRLELRPEDTVEVVFE